MWHANFVLGKKKIWSSITVMAILAGFSRCAASGKPLSPVSCFDNQSKRSLRPSAPSLASVSAVVTYGTYNKELPWNLPIRDQNCPKYRYDKTVTILSRWTAASQASNTVKVHSLIFFLLSPRHFKISDKTPCKKTFYAYSLPSFKFTIAWPQTLLDFSTAGPMAEATAPRVIKVAITKFLLLSYRRPLRPPNNSPDNQIKGTIMGWLKMFIKENDKDMFIYNKK